MTASPTANSPTVSSQSRMAGLRKLRERFIMGMLIACGGFTILITGTIIVILACETFGFFQLEEVSFGEFITGTQWSPLLGAEKHFGICPALSRRFF